MAEQELATMKINPNLSVTEKIKQYIFNNDFDNYFCKTTWRLSGGNKDKAYSLIREVAKHYHFNPTDLEIEIALGEMNDGFEVEWNS